jgi:methylenetetrahydrofolate reductase (NADPH)
MSPLAAVALAREQGVSTIVHVSCRDRNRLALRSQVVGAAALGSEGVLCLYGDPVGETPRVKDMTATELISTARQWAEPHDLAVGAVVNPFAVDQDRELRLLERKVLAGAEYVQSQMVFDVDVLAAFLERAADLLHGVRFYAGIALLRDEQMANRGSRPSCRGNWLGVAPAGWDVMRRLPRGCSRLVAGRVWCAARGVGARSPRRSWGSSSRRASRGL